MQCAVLVEPKRVEVREVAIPDAPPGGVVVRVRAALTDGTDLKAYRRGHPKMPMPTRFGHEFSGDVAAVGAGVTVFVPGSPIMCVHSAPCGSCFWCARAEEELCESVMTTMILGAYAQYIEVPARIVERNAFPKPADLSYVAAAFLEPLSCVVHSLDVLKPADDATVLVIGDGGFGLLHGMLLARRGVRIAIAGRRRERLALARDFGIEHTIDMRERNLSESVAALTQGRGADAVVECTGVQEVWEAAPAFVRRGGTVSLFGGLPPDARVSFEAARLHYDEVRVVSPFHFRPASVRRAYDLLTRGGVDPTPLVTERLPLSHVGEVFARLDAGDGLKFAIEP